MLVVDKHLRIVDVLSIVNDGDCHELVVWQVGKKLWCDEKVLALATAASDVDEHLEDFSLVLGVHALIDLIDTSERNTRDVLETQRVNSNGNCAFAA